jgi:hypothetical protein
MVNPRGDVGELLARRKDEGGDNGGCLGMAFKIVLVIIAFIILTTICAGRSRKSASPTPTRASTQISAPTAISLNATAIRLWSPTRLNRPQTD